MAFRMMLRTRLSAARAGFGCDPRYSFTELILALAKQMLRGDLSPPGPDVSAHA